MKKVLSVIFIVIFVFVSVPLTVNAANGVEQKLQEVVNMFPNYSYFSVNGNACPAGHGSSCSNCYYPNVVSSRLGWNWSNMYSSWSCYGFTCFVTRYVFGTEWPNNSYVLGTANVSNTSACDSLFSNAKIGDVVSIGTAHRVIFLRKANNGIVVYDSNQGDKNGLCNQVRYEKTMTYSGIKNYYGSVTLTVNRMNNYDEISGSSASTDLGTNFYGLIIHKESWTPLTVESNGNVDLTTENYTANQYWKFLRNDDGTYTMLSALNGQALDLANFGTADGTNIGVCTVNNTSAQKWSLIPCGSGYQIKAQCTECVMEMNAWSFYEHVNIVSGTRDGSSAEIFTIYKVDWGTISKVKLQYETYGNQVIFSWKSAPTITNYNIKMRKVGETEFNRNLWDVKNNSYTIKLEPGQYEAYVESYNGNLDYCNGDSVVFEVNSLVSYNGNGLESDIPSQEKPYSSNILLNCEIPTRTGYIFKEWNTSADGSGVSYQPGDTYSENADLSLYAIWAHDTFNFISDSPLTYDAVNKFIYGSNLSSMTAEGIADIFNNTNTVVNTNDGVIATGTTVGLVDDTNTTYDTATVVVFGDVNGDGYFDGEDSIVVSAIVNGCLSKDSLSEAELFAADCNHDGIINSDDVVLLEQVGLLNQTVKQEI